MNRILLIETAINTYNIIFFTKKLLSYKLKNQFSTQRLEIQTVFPLKKNKKKKKKRNNKPGARTRNYEFPSSNLKLHLETPFFPSSRSIPRVKEFHPRPRPISPSSSKRKLESSCLQGKKDTLTRFRAKSAAVESKRAPALCMADALAQEEEAHRCERNVAPNYPPT